MNDFPQIAVHRDPDLLCAAVAARLVTRLVDAQWARGHAHVVLTGGSVGVGVLAALARSAARDAVDWSTVHVWWGDERYLPYGHADRNETQAREALLDLLPLDARLVHPMGSPDDGSGGVDAAARRYAAELARVAQAQGAAGSRVPVFDVLLLGVGPDAHVASLFPGLAGVQETERSVVGVPDSPKPPPLRVSLTLPAIQHADEVWLVAAGGEKAAAIGLALGGAQRSAAPAGAASGRRATRWLLDQAAAAQVPPGLLQPADR